MENFWQKLNKPFFALAPMADVTDIAFREIITKYGKPDVFWTEFVSADGLCDTRGREKLSIDLAYTEAERPIVAQIFSSKPDNMRKAAGIILELGFDGLDINMGCPDRSIEKQGAGAAHIKDFKTAQEVIRAAQEGVKGKIPVSVKTRVGYNKDILEEWMEVLLQMKPAVITMHARTRKEMSKVPARWEAVARAVKIRDRFQCPALGIQKGQTLIIGNGDVKDLADAETKAKETGSDGVMLGRAIFGNPWLFARIPRFGLGNSKRPDLGILTTEKKLRVLVEHTKLFEKLLGGKKNFSIMKKHYKAYVNGFPACRDAHGLPERSSQSGAGRDGAKELRAKLMEAKNAGEVESIVKEFFEVSCDKQQ